MTDVDYLKQATVRELAGYLIEDGAPSIEAALDDLERSPVLEKVLDERTGLYLSGPAHVYEYVKDGFNANGDTLRTTRLTDADSMTRI